MSLKVLLCELQAPYQSKKCPVVVTVETQLLDNKGSSSYM